MIDPLSIDWHLVGSAAGAFFTVVLGWFLKRKGDTADKKITDNEKRIDTHADELGDLRNTIQTMISYSRMQELVLKACEEERAMLRDVRVKVFDILKLQLPDDDSPVSHHSEQLRHSLLDILERRMKPEDRS